MYILIPAWFPTDRAHVEDTILLLENRRIERENELAQHAVTDFSQDENTDSECPIYDSFFAAFGDHGISRMINFNTEEFRDIFEYYD